VEEEEKCKEIIKRMITITKYMPNEKK